MGDLTSKGADAEDLKLLAVWARVETNTFFMKAKSGKVMPPALSPLPPPLAVAQGAEGGLQTHQHLPGICSQWVIFQHFASFIKILQSHSVSGPQT